MNNIMLKCCVSLIALGVAVPVSSAQAASAGRQLSETRHFSIPAQDLSGALSQFARMTGLQLAAAPDTLRGRRSRAISGVMTSEAALKALVAGAHVETRISGGTIIVRPGRAVRPTSALKGAGRAPVAQAMAANNSPAGEQQNDSGNSIIVTGYAEAVQEALNVKRKSTVISDTVSADDMGELPANNVSEALARLPGVNAVRSPTTGEGDRITVRGLSTEYNNYSMNGVRLGGAGAREDNFYRGVRLSVLPPDGIKQITVYKSLTPDRDGDALGGTIDVQTPTAFDYDKSTYARLSLEGGMIDKYDNPKSGQISGAFAQRITDTLGVFVSGSWSNRKSKFERNGVDGDNQPDTWYSDSETLGWDPNRFVLRGMDLTVGETEVERYGFNGSLDYQTDEHKVHIRGQYNKYTKKEFSNRLNFRNDTGRNSTRLTQVNSEELNLAQPDDAVIGYDDSLGRIYNYTAAQIVDRDGDGVITDADRSARSFYSLNGKSGTWDPQGFRLRRFWEGSSESGTLFSLNIGGISQFATVTFDYDVSYSQSEDNLDDSYEMEFRSDKYGWLGNTGVLFSASEDSRFPKWLLNQAGMEAVHDPAQYAFSGLSGDVDSSKEKLWQAQANLKWEPDSAWLSSVKAGGKFYDSRRTRRKGSYMDLDATGTLADFSSFYGDEVTSMFGGAYSGLYRLGITIDNDKMLSEMRKVKAGESTVFDGTVYQSDNVPPNTTDTFDFNERVISGYAMATMKWGNAQIIAGARVEATRNKISSYMNDPIMGQYFGDDSSDYINVLPSVHVNYDFTPRTKLRGAIWTSFARPDIVRMSSARSYSYDQDPDGDGARNPTSEWILMSISQGNPDLKPMRSVNFDLSLEQYNGSTGAYSIAAYYKRITNFLFRSSSSNIRNGTKGVEVLPEGVELTMPQNGDWAEVYGVEMNAQQIMHWLPGVLGSLGVGANLTLQKSKAVTGLSWHPDGYTLPLIETPETIANVQLFWERKGWEIYAAWNYQSKFLQDIQDFGNNPHDQPYSFIDLTLRKTLFGKSTATLQVQNLLDNQTYWQTAAESQGSSRAYIKTGRSITLGLNFIF